MRVLLVIGVVVYALLGCNSGDDEGDAGSSGASGSGGDGGGDEACNVTAPTACPSPAPTYADVAPIFEQRCVSCHQGAGQSEVCPICWALTDYSHVVSWEAEIRAAMLDCDMPPPNSGVTMTDAERMKVLEWIRCESPP